MATETDPSPGSLTAKWKKIAKHEVLKRSSHSVAAIGEESADGDGYELFVFGGEVVARQPKDGDVHVLNAGMCDLFYPLIETVSINVPQLTSSSIIV